MKFFNFLALLHLILFIILLHQVEGKKFRTSKIIKSIKTHEKEQKISKNEQFYKAAGIIETWGWDEFKDWCKDSYNKTKDWAKDTYDKGKDWAKGEQKNIKNEQFYKAAGIIEAWGWDEFKDWCKDSYNKTKDWAKDTYDKGKDWAKGNQNSLKLISKSFIQTFDVNNYTSDEIAELEDALEQITPILTEAFDNGPESYGQVKQQVLSEIQEVYGQEGVQVVHFLFEKFEINYIRQKMEENRSLLELAFALGGKEQLEAIQQEYLELLTPILEPAAIQEIENFFDSIYSTQTLLDDSDTLQDVDSDSDDTDYDGSYEDIVEDFDSDDQDSETEDSTSEIVTNDEDNQNDEADYSSQQILLLKEKNSGIQMLKPSVEMHTLPWLNYLIFAFALAFILFGLYKCLGVGKNNANNRSVSQSYKLFKKETEIEEHFL